MWQKNIQKVYLDHATEWLFRIWKPISSPFEETWDHFQIWHLGAMFFSRTGQEQTFLQQFSAVTPRKGAVLGQNYHRQWKKREKKTGSFMKTLDVNEAGNQLVNVQNLCLGWTCIQWRHIAVRLLGLQRHYSLRAGVKFTPRRWSLDFQGWIVTTVILEEQL